MSVSDQLPAKLPGISPAVARFLEASDGQDPYAVATVVRVVGASAARPGQKVIVTGEGDIIGFAGGGCVKTALRKAGADAIRTGEPQFIRTQPKDQLADHGNVEGLQTYASGCPSRGEVDIFIEPVLPKPTVFVAGDNEIADNVLLLAESLGLASVRVSMAKPPTTDSEAVLIDDLPVLGGLSSSYVVLATQGNGDKAGLEAALKSACPHVLFVASRKKATFWRNKLEKAGFGRDALDRLTAPAGLNIGAKLPAEIALSILAQIVELKNAKPSSLSASKGEVA